MSTSHPLFDAALAAHSAKRFAEAEQLYRQFLHTNPTHAPAMQMLAMVAHEGGDNRTAIELTRRAISFQPGVREYHNNLGVFLAADHQFANAVDAYNDALKIDGLYPGAVSNLGAALKELNRIDEAIGACRMAMRLQPEHAPAHINLANALLVAGQLEEGFCEYEWRLRVPTSDSHARTFTQPRWDGTALDNRTILLHAEQGFGDTIQFARFATLFAKFHPRARVLLAVQPQLLKLVNGLPGVSELMAWDQSPAEGFDVHCPLMSVPYQMSITREEQIGAASREPYIHADARLIGQWLTRVRAAIGDRTPRLKIGLCWTGRAEQSHNRARSVPVSLLTTLSAFKDVTFFSLQKPAELSLDFEKASRELSLIDFTADLLDFTDTAALIANLDLVITVDTAVAHLAGAMGKPVWILLAHVPDWRYQLKRTDSPWYPSARLFRQLSAGDWTAPLQSVFESLHHLAR